MTLSEHVPTYSNVLLPRVQVLLVFAARPDSCVDKTLSLFSNDIVTDYYDNINIFDDVVVIVSLIRSIDMSRQEFLRIKYNILIYQKNFNIKYNILSR